jgi:hypothetical protein
MRRLLFLALAGFAVASCAAPRPMSNPVAVPQPQVAKPAPTAETRLEPVIQPKGDWLDWPLTNGQWVYRRDERGSIALFGKTGEDAVVTLRCDKSQRILYLSRAGFWDHGDATIRTSSTMKQFKVRTTGGKPSYMAASISPDDPILDAMAYSRGRIALQFTSQTSIAIPVWSEIGRVTEDCRA